MIGHFDLITKFNEAERFFDPQDPRYRQAALTALEALAPGGKLLEINTGAMARGYRQTPYPAAFLLRAWRELGGRILISSDCHHRDYLTYGFPQAVELAKSCGFRSSWLLQADGWIERPL